eukprot:SAG31_NODE_1144_length_9687_cov_10.800167_5_plen_67_part_00
MILTGTTSCLMVAAGGTVRRAAAPRRHHAQAAAGRDHRMHINHDINMAPSRGATTARRPPAQPAHL